MKKFMLLNLFALSLTLPTVGQAVVLSDEVTDGVTVSSFVVEKMEGAESDHYVCLGSKHKDFRIDSRIKDLRKFDKAENHGIFSDLGPTAKNCFSPVKVKEIHVVKKELDAIFKLIDLEASHNLNALVNTDGSAVMKPMSEEDFANMPNSLTRPKPGQGLLRNEDKSLGRKLLRAELIVGGVEAFGMGLLINLPRSITKWDDDWQDDAKKSLKRAWTQAPVWDKDEMWINYIGHPLAGAVYYNALRSQGANRLQSLLFSTVQSTIWEYGIEAIAERPSIQDLFVTPLVGSAIGELAHLGTMRMRRNGFSLGEKVLITVINPSYVINNGYK